MKAQACILVDRLTTMRMRKNALLLGTERLALALAWRRSRDSVVSSSCASGSLLVSRVGIQLLDLHISLYSYALCTTLCRPGRATLSIAHNRLVTSRLIDLNTFVDRTAGEESIGLARPEHIEHFLGGVSTRLDTNTQPHKHKFNSWPSNFPP